MLGKKINFYVLFNGYVRELRDVALDIPLFSRLPVKVIELGKNECGKIHRNVYIKKIPRRNGWTLQLVVDRHTYTIAHNTVRRGNFLKGFTGLTANTKNINYRLDILENNATLYGKEMFLPNGHFLAISNTKDGTADLLPIK